MLCHDVFVNICYRCANICKIRTTNICYVMFMLTVCWAMDIYVMLTCYMYSRVPFYTRNKHLNKTNNTGYPALDPTANKYYQVPAGGKTYFCCFYCFYVFLKAFYVFSCLFSFYNVFRCVFSIVNATA